MPNNSKKTPLTPNVFIALGSNLNNPSRQVLTAFDALEKLLDTELIKTSSLYQNSPLGPQDQPDFVNAVAQLSTRLTPFELLEQLQIIEKNQGKQVIRHWGERTIDLDILLYSDKHIQSDTLTIPHPDMLKRNFVVFPLLEICPNLRLPNKQSLIDIAASLSRL